MSEDKDAYITPPTETDSGNGALCRVSVKVPEFWPNRPDVWFAQLEAQFVLAKNTEDSTKFYHVISQLGNQYTAEVIDVISSPPATGKYDKLKSEIIKRLSASQEKKVKQLLVHEELGERKPSQFLRHLQSLAGPTVPEDFLRTIWSSRLPHNIQTIVATQTDTSLEKVAELADKIFELAPPTSSVFAASSGSNATPTVAAASTSGSNVMPPYMQEMTKQIAELTRCVAQLTAQERPQFRRSRFRGRSSSRDRSSSKPRICFYHRKFGAKANRCTTPCSYHAKNTEGSRQ
ncbi:uncharacterized protein LOC126381620 [Pectinophora gossypiella]|uniref:uncharacterized protein LOC126381620 n=1 Tax=Pectinophora gossypiella TaxID=13191 RepID=UPI00214F3B43|nr:uncharacterized protein LOC126381620 [Pectinophora gossypiella]